MKLMRTVAYRDHICTKCGKDIKSGEITFSAGNPRRYFCEKQGERMIQTSIVTQVVNSKSIENRMPTQSDYARYVRRSKFI